ncbi:MAG TPA: TRAP transporter large permease subunit [Stellaceae bacterium]|nr:TRAP transporter large permease subunit [Stellaceae bacterium]
MEWAGFPMLAAVALGLVATGLPAFMVLIGVALFFAVLGLVAGALPYPVLTALPFRIIGLLENDLLQALPLYVLMGALLNRLPLADILFRAGSALFARSAAAPLLSAIGLGALLAPMNGSVGASAATLSRVVEPRLLASGVSAPQGVALVALASTLGVVVPPSLVLILLGDSMLRAHTEAINATHLAARVINTQDVFQGALPPALLFLATAIAVAWLVGRGRSSRLPAVSRLRAGEWLAAFVALTAIVALLVAVVSGHLYAVEAAATGAVALFAFGLITRHLDGPILMAALRDTMGITGALFALFVGATTFTLVFRALSADAPIAALIAAIPGGPAGAAVATLVLLGLCALVLDAFEIILVIIPLVMPPLLVRVPDAVWLAALTLLALQTSFLLPPFGYAVMTVRTLSAQRVSDRALTRALLPFLAAQLAVLVLTVAFPALTHLAQPASLAATPRSDAQVREQLENIVPIAPLEDAK